MATQTFTATDHQGKQQRFEPRTATYNGVSGHIWKRWVLERGRWMLDGQQFQHIKATRKEIVDAWMDDDDSEEFPMRY